jgi:hypothetical protein
MIAALLPHPLTSAISEGSGSLRNSSEKGQMIHACLFQCSSVTVQSPLLKSPLPQGDDSMDGGGRATQDAKAEG